MCKITVHRCKIIIFSKFSQYFSYSMSQFVSVLGRYYQHTRDCVVQVWALCCMHGNVSPTYRGLSSPCISSLMYAWQVITNIQETITSMCQLFDVCLASYHQHTGDYHIHVSVLWCVLGKLSPTYRRLSHPYVSSLVCAWQAITNIQGTITPCVSSLMSAWQAITNIQGTITSMCQLFDVCLASYHQHTGDCHIHMSALWFVLGKLSPSYRRLTSICQLFGVCLASYHQHTGDYHIHMSALWCVLGKLSPTYRRLSCPCVSSLMCAWQAVCFCFKKS